MTRRKAIIATVVAFVGIETRTAKTSPLVSSSTGPVSILAGPQMVMVDLDTYKEFTFTLGQKTVTITADDIFAALSA